MLHHILESKLLAENAVKDGDNTLKKANDTYHLLQSFQSEVQKSSQAAQIALEQVPKIQGQIETVNNLIRDTESVSGIDNRIKIYLFILII